MQVINDSNPQSIQMLGGSQIRTKGKKYRLNKFCLKAEVEEGTLIYNELTGSLIMLKDVELSNIFTEDPCDYVNYMVGNYFLVPENYDEEYILKVIKDRKVVPLTDNYLDHPSIFTILTTSACNARCFYCYELGLKGKSHMSAETAEKVAKYIINYANVNGQITLDWFGGEPLFNNKVIDIITSRIASAGINFRSSMVSNGYLFDEKMVKKAKDDWRLTNVQITLDGTEEIYNKTKNYIYKDCDSPFKKVITNIHLLLDLDISVSIRMNCDKHNTEDLSNLVDYLSDEFKDEVNLSMYVWPIFEDDNYHRTPEERKKLFEALEAIEGHMMSKGIDVGHNIGMDIKGVHCMIDSGNAICIYPKGEIGVCEHYLDSRFVSHIDNPTEKNWEVLKEWRKFTPYTELCDDCPLKPECLKAIGCPDEMPCDEYQKHYTIKHYIYDIKRRYEQFKKNQNEQNCNGSCQCSPHSPICPPHNDMQPTAQQCPKHSPVCPPHYEGGVLQRIFSDGRVEYITNQ